MARLISSLLLALLVTSCSTTPITDWETIEQYVHPQRKVLETTDGKPFTHEELLKAKRWARENDVNLLFYVVLDKDGNMIKRRIVKKGSGLDQDVVSHFKMQLTESKISSAVKVVDNELIFVNYDKPTALFFPITIQQEVEIY